MGSDHRDTGAVHDVNGGLFSGIESKSCPHDGSGSDSSTLRAISEGDAVRRGSGHYRDVTRRDRKQMLRGRSVEIRRNPGDVTLGAPHEPQNLLSDSTADRYDQSKHDH